MGLASQVFHYVLVMGNSLGYGPDSSSDMQILAEARRVLRPGGRILIDVADGEAIRNKFKPEAWHEIGEDILVCRRRELRADTVSVREIVLSKKNGLIRDRTYSIRFYESGKISGLLGHAGFEEVSVIKDFSPHGGRGDCGFMNHRMIAMVGNPDGLAVCWGFAEGRERIRERRNNGDNHHFKRFVLSRQGSGGKAGCKSLAMSAFPARYSWKPPRNSISRKLNWSGRSRMLPGSCNVLRERRKST